MKRCVTVASSDPMVLELYHLGGKDKAVSEMIADDL